MNSRSSSRNSFGDPSEISPEYLRYFVQNTCRKFSKNYSAVPHAISSEFLREILQISSGISLGALPGIPSGFRHDSSRNFIEFSSGIIQSTSCNSLEILRNSTRNSSGATLRIPLDFIPETTKVPPRYPS